jgi:predicted amidohydrolase
LLGDELGLFEIDGVKIGIGICFDLRYPEYFRELTRNGAKIIFLPAHFRKNTGSMAWKVLPEARAIENQVYFCACNQTGKGLIGNSKIISYDGSIVKSLEDEEDILTAEIDLDSQNEYRQKFPILKQI